MSAENAGAEGVGCGISNLYRLVDGLGAHEEADRSEEFFLRNAHLRCDIYEEGGLEVVAFGIFGVEISGAPHYTSGALVDSVSDEAFEAVEPRRRDHGAYINPFTIVKR